MRDLGAVLDHEGAAAASGLRPAAVVHKGCPVCGASLNMRDLAQMLAHVHDAEIEICEGPVAAAPSPLH